MFSGTSDQTPERIGFLLVPEFSMIALFSAVEPLRIANRLSGRALYEWRVFSQDGGPVEASNGMTMLADAAISAVTNFPTVVVCSSFDPERHVTKALLNWLRRLARQGAEIGGIDTGAQILARAGLLDGRQATVHWENLPSFAESYPDITVSDDLFEIDGKRFTCSGGTAAIDMMLNAISKRHGEALGIAVSESMLHDRIRSPGDHQRMALGLRLGVRHPKLIAILEAMERAVEDPLSLDDLAALGGVSRRQLERLFRNHLGDTPTGYYLKLRLRRSRQLLEHTEMSVMQVATACGFVSAPYFSRAYRNLFGRSPREDRRLGRPNTGRRLPPTSPGLL